MTVMINRYLSPLIVLASLCLWGQAWGQGAAPSGGGLGVPSNPYVRPANSVSVLDYGAVGDFTAQTSGGSTTASSTAFSNTGVTFGAGDVGKKITIYGAGANGNNLTTTISAVNGSSATLAASASYGVSSSTYYLGSAAVSAAGTGYVPGDTIGFTAGTYATAAQVKVLTTQVVSATVANGGTGCTNGASQTVTGTTGAAGIYFVANVTIAGNTITAVNSITTAGAYTTNPTTLTAEPVNGYQCTGAQLSVVMGVNTAQVTYQGNYSVQPGNPVAQASTSGSGTGATFTMTWSTGGAWQYGTDNATTLQNAINAAVSAGKSLYIPSAGTSQCYGYTAPLTIGGNLNVVGDYNVGNWGSSGIALPSGRPPLQGSILCPSANGSDGIDISASFTGAAVNFTNISVMFQQWYGQGGTTTGDCFHYIPSGTNQGLSGFYWQNVTCFGHDGNHYGYNLQNFIYGTMVNAWSFGGGGFNLYGTSSFLNYGNSTFIEPYTEVITGGSAHGYNIAASAAQRLNLIYFIRPQSIVNNLPGGVTNQTPVSSAQYIWKCDTNVTAINTTAEDYEAGASGAPVQICKPTQNNTNFQTIGTDAGIVYSPAWTQFGVLYGNKGTPVVDTTSTGTVTNMTAHVFPSNNMNAVNPITVTHLSTLYLGVPVSGNNISATRIESLYSQGGAYFNSNIVVANGEYLTGVLNQSGGAVNLNTSSNYSVEVGDGTNTQPVTIGGTSNTTNLSSATIKTANLPTDATHTDRSICEDTTTFQLYYGSGTLGICLGTSSARYKHDIAPLDAGLAQITALKPVKYKLNADHGDPNKLLYGFTAEQGSKVLPALSDKDANGKPNTFDYVGVVPVLVKAVQELKADNDNLRADIKRLRKHR